MRKRRLSEEKLRDRKALSELLNLAYFHFSVSEGTLEEYKDRRLSPTLVMAERFVAEYGHLRPQSDNLLAEYEVLEYAERFRQVVAYAARRQFGTAERMLGEIFRAANPIANEGQAFIPDLNAETGTIAFKPATLLQRLALELLQSRKALKRCTVCKRFFFPAKGNRQGYCDNALSDCRSESRRKKSVVNTRNFRARQERKRKGNTDAKRSDRKN